MRRLTSWPGRAWLPPYQVVLAAFGIVVGLVPELPHVRLEGVFILGVFVPALVFEAALNLDLSALRSVAWRVTMLASAGVLLTIALVAVPVHHLLGLSWPSAVLLGAILSPTDPIAVVAVVRRSAAPARLAALLEGESLFNDGTGVAVFAAVVATLAQGDFSPSQSGLRFLLLAGGGAMAGGLIGLVLAALVRRTSSAPLEVALTLLAAYGSYGAAQAVGASGVMAVVAAGAAMARVATWGARTERHWARIAIVLNAVLFTLIGVSLPASAVLSMLPAVAAGFLILLAARLLPVQAFGWGLPATWRLMLWWGGMRGALSVALALAATGARGAAHTVPVLAYGIVTLSLLLQGSSIRQVARLLAPTEVASSPPGRN